MEMISQYVILWCILFLLNDKYLALLLKEDSGDFGLKLCTSFPVVLLLRTVMAVVKGGFHEFY